MDHYFLWSINKLLEINPRCLHSLHSLEIECTYLLPVPKRVVSRNPLV